MFSGTARWPLLLLVWAPVRGEDSAPPPDAPVASETRTVESWLEAQVELHRRGFSCGGIDGILGPQTRAALSAFQRGAGIRDTGELDPATRERLPLTAPALTTHTVTAEELASLRPLPDTWLGKSEESHLGYATAPEMLAERYRATPNFLRQINPNLDWAVVAPGTEVEVPAVAHATITGIPTKLVIGLETHELEVVDDLSRVVAHFPVSIARAIEKRPTGKLHITVIIPDPYYTFDPAVFPESAEGRMLGRKLLLPPGPNNPVGVAWIGLDRPGYGIHGTPDPENVGRTESHGCFRLANWDALTLLHLVHVGMNVLIEP